MKLFQILSLLLALLSLPVLVTARAATHARTVFSQALPRLDGSRLQVTTVEVTYPPGGSSAPHSHPCPVIGYVLKGAVRMQVKGGVPATYTAGESFYEAPNGIHLISENVSATEPAIFLTFFIVRIIIPPLSSLPTSFLERRR